MKENFMQIAINESKKAYRKGEVPVGVVIVKDDKIISKAYNNIESKNDATAHAEINAIKKASKKLKNWRLIDCDMYVTLEPCEMCSGAIKLSRIKNVYYLLDKKNKITQKKYKKIKYNNEEYLNLIQSFFKNKRM